MYDWFYQAIMNSRARFSKDRHFELFRALTREQYLPSSEMHERQLSRLREVLAYAQQHSRYYKRLFEVHRIDPGRITKFGDLESIPVLDRKAVQDYREEIVVTDVEGLYANSSGGSTGNPVNFFHDAAYQRHARAADLLHKEWMGLSIGERTATVWGADRDVPSTGVAPLVNRLTKRKIYLNSFNIDRKRVDRFIEQLNAFRPRLVHGYASSLYAVALRILETAPLKFQPKAVRTSAEMLYDHFRTGIEQAFATDVYNFYGSREVNNIAAECEQSSGLHVFSSGRIVELLDSRGFPVSPGEPGNVVVTDLYNRAFPFIRYVNGDIAEWSAEPCPCGRKWPTLRRIVGRTSDTILVGERKIHGEYFTHLFYGYPDIRQFQLIQYTKSFFKLFVVRSHARNSDDGWQEKIREVLGPETSLEIVWTEQIEPGPTGKHRYVISKI